MTFWLLLILLSLCGMAETAYLILCRVQKRHPLCSSDGACRLVLDSKYNSLFGFHNDVMGFFFYLAVFVDLLLIGTATGPVPVEFLALNALLIGGAVMSIVFTFIQWKLIKSWCLWCLMSACTTWLMAGVFFVAVMRSN